MRIAVDAMGSDNYPGPDVEGAVMAAREFGLEIALIGDKGTIDGELARHDTGGLSIEVIHASEIIEMTDKPADAAKHKQDSSMHVGLRLVKDGAADAFVTAGNTGGVLAVATLHSLGRIRGIKRPALTAVFENYTGMTVLTDFGANSDCKPDWLLQFAIMADLYTKLAVGLKEPRIALLSNGEEEGKGNDLVRETHPLMKTLPGINYIGPVEPKEVMMGHTDVVIVDGYVGNIMGKSLEAMGSMIARVIRDEIMKGTLSKVGGMLIRPAMKNVRSKMDPAAEIGGIPLLGLEGLVIVGHGRSNARAIRSAIRQARNAIETQVVEAIREGIS